METIEIVGIIVSIIGIGSFAAIFTILYVTYTNATISEFRSGKKDIELIDEAIYDNLAHVKKRREIIKTIKSIGFYGLMIIIIPIFAFSLLNKFNGNVTMLGNQGILVVASGSMSEKNEANGYLIENNLNNQFNTYDTIVIKKVRYESDLALYDVIAFVDSEGKTVIHRIIDIEFGTDGRIHYETRGDSNNASDKFRPCIDDIQGKYTGKRIPIIGMFVLFMQSPIGIITVVGLLYCLFTTDRLTEKLFREQQKRLDKLSVAIDYENETQLGVMEAQYYETIYYKGYLYKFNEEGFVDKEEITDKEILEKSNSSIIKIIENKNNEEICSKEYVIDEQNEEKEGE